jgi:hypothetical protein
MFCSYSWPFSLLPLCLPIVPPDIAQVTGSFGHHWGPNGGFPQGTELEHMLGHLECPQGHDLLTILELPTSYGTALQYERV